VRTNTGILYVDLLTNLTISSNLIFSLFLGFQLSFCHLNFSYHLTPESVNRTLVIDVTDYVMCRILNR